MKKILILLLASGLALAGCQSKPKNTRENQSPMKATIVRKLTFTDLPSASGMEVVGNRIYVIGDDSPYLYVLDPDSHQVVDKVELFSTGDFGTGRIPKALKPDLEALTTIRMDDRDHLLALGSGSAPTRAKGYSLALPAADGKPGRVKAHSLLALYQKLQADEKLLGGDLLNLEAAATTPDQVWLLQRATAAETNLLLAFSYPEFVQYLTVPGAPVPSYSAITFHLPAINHLPARFSGATTHGQFLFISASVEDTDHPVLDGEVLGSFIGCIPLDQVKPGAAQLTLKTAPVLHPDGSTYAGKVEALAIIGTTQNGVYRALAFTDNDDGTSELLELEIE